MIILSIKGRTVGSGLGKWGKNSGQNNARFVSEIAEPMNYSVNWIVTYLNTYAEKNLIIGGSKLVKTLIERKLKSFLYCVVGGIKWISVYQVGINRNGRLNGQLVYCLPKKLNVKQRSHPLVPLIITDSVRQKVCATANENLWIFHAHLSRLFSHYGPFLLLMV